MVFILNCSFIHYFFIARKMICQTPHVLILIYENPCSSESICAQPSTSKDLSRYGKSLLLYSWTIIAYSNCTCLTESIWYFSCWLSKDIELPNDWRPEYVLLVILIGSILMVRCVYSYFILKLFMLNYKLIKKYIVDVRTCIHYDFLKDHGKFHMSILGINWLWQCRSIMVSWYYLFKFLGLMIFIRCHIKNVLIPGCVCVEAEGGIMYILFVHNTQQLLPLPLLLLLWFGS